jgi:signal transduction histidine kinase
MSSAAPAPGTPAPGPPHTPVSWRPPPWIGEGGIAAVRGLAFCGLALAGAGLLLALVAVAAALAGIGLVFFVGYHHRLLPPGPRVILGSAAACAWIGGSRLVVPRILLAIRRLANLTRRLAGQWCGVTIAVPYLPPPDGSGRKAGFRWWPRWLLTEPATWRDMQWLAVDACAGWVLAVLPAALLAFLLLNIVAPYHKAELFLASAAGAAFGLWAAPRLLRGHALFARTLLAPTGQAELAMRVRHLAQTRSETIDTGAAELRRIERDLHDGAQARLVAMGMTLSAAEQLLDESPAAARALLIEARDSSAKALAELRDLVRGICPPVLADRGLAEAVRALALDSPLRVHLASDPASRFPAPVESAAYFTVSELLANVSKHADASEIWIDIRHSAGMLRIGVTDNGRGGADPGRGTGLRGIERRLAAFDGVLAVSSPPGGPTAVTMEIPCAL